MKTYDFGHGIRIPASQLVIEKTIGGIEYDVATYGDLHLFPSRSMHDAAQVNAAKSELYQYDKPINIKWQP